MNPSPSPAVGEWDAALQRVAAESLEALSGVIPAPRETAVQSAAPWEAAYRVEFEGAARGEMRLTFFGGAAAAVAEGMIGRGEGPDAADALGELSNIVCGNFLPFVYGATAEFHLTKPASAGRGEGPVGAPKAAARLPFGDGRVEVHFRERGRP